MMLERDTVVVSEIFGPTIQGEGPSCGRRSGFLRLGGCNLSCTWCDTPYTWDWKGTGRTGVRFDPKIELHAESVNSVVDRLCALDVPLVVVTGGEPLQQQGALVPICRALTASGMDVEIETNGSIFASDELIACGPRFNVSPKLAHSGVPFDKAINWTALNRFGEIPTTAFKFVCCSPKDFDEIDSVMGRISSKVSIWIMPEGADAATLLNKTRELADEVIRRGWNLTTRLHVIAWGNRRGV